MPGKDKKPGGERESGSSLCYDLQLVRTLDSTLKKLYPDGVSLLVTLERGKVIELHRRIRQAFNPHACMKAEELTQYLWLVGRTVAMEISGGITIGGRRDIDKYVIGRAFYRDAEAEYRILHTLISKALG